MDLQQIDKSGPKLRFSQTIAGQPAAGLLPGIVEASLNELPIPKRMRWAARREEFVRPTQWLVMLFGDDVVECEILAQKAGRESVATASTIRTMCVFPARQRIWKTCAALMCWPISPSAAS